MVEEIYCRFETIGKDRCLGESRVNMAGPCEEKGEGKRASYQRGTAWAKSIAKTAELYRGQSSLGGQPSPWVREV